MTRPRQRYGCPSMGEKCADYNDTGEPCRFCHAETVPVFPCVNRKCDGWATQRGMECIECATVTMVEALRPR